MQLVTHSKFLHSSHALFPQHETTTASINRSLQIEQRSSLGMWMSSWLGSQLFVWFISSYVFFTDKYPVSFWKFITVFLMDKLAIKPSGDVSGSWHNGHVWLSESRSLFLIPGIYNKKIECEFAPCRPAKYLLYESSFFYRFQNCIN